MDGRKGIGMNVKYGWKDGRKGIRMNVMEGCVDGWMEGCV